LIQENSGNNQFLGHNGDEIIQGNNDDGSGDDFLWAKSGKDFLIGEIEADECDCGKGFHIILTIINVKRILNLKTAKYYKKNLL
jgi:hypothetical protein